MKALAKEEMARELLGMGFSRDAVERRLSLRSNRRFRFVMRSTAKDEGGGMPPRFHFRTRVAIEDIEGQ